MDEIALRVVVRGRVQGVGYRYWMVREAVRHDVRGWVRNRRDGSVEALVIGRAGEVEDLIAACRTGPPAAQVTGIERQAALDDGAAQFYERPTA